MLKCVLNLPCSTASIYFSSRKWETENKLHGCLTGRPDSQKSSARKKTAAWGEARRLQLIRVPLKSVSIWKGDHDGKGKTIRLMRNS